MLFRTTYQDHWFDNFGNAIVGHMFAQVIIWSRNNVWVYVRGKANSIWFTEKEKSKSKEQNV